MSLARWLRIFGSDGRRGGKEPPPSVHCDPVCENPCRLPSQRYLIGGSSLSEEDQMSKLEAYLKKQWDRIDNPFLAYEPDAEPPFDLFEFYETFFKERIEKEASFEGSSKWEMSWSSFLCWWVNTPLNLQPAVLDCMRKKRIEVSDHPTTFRMRTPPFLFCWLQAEEGFYNIHVHASVKNDREFLYAISYAYLIRDCKGDVRYKSFGAFDCTNDGGDYVLFGEVLAIKDSLQACLSMDMLSVKIYTECVDAYKIFHGEDFPSDLRVYEENKQANLGEVVSAVKEMMDLMTSCDVLLCDARVNVTAQLLSGNAYEIVHGKLSNEKKLEIMQAVEERVAMEKEKKGCFEFVFLH